MEDGRSRVVLRFSSPWPPLQDAERDQKQGPHVVTVLDRYGHLQPGMQDQVTDALDQLALERSPSGPERPESAVIDRKVRARGGHERCAYSNLARPVRA